MNNYNFDNRRTFKETIVDAAVHSAIFLGSGGAMWLVLIGLDRIMGLMGLI